MVTKIVPISDLRRKTKDIIDMIQEQEAVYVTQHGRPVVVLVDYEHYEHLLAQLQDLSDQLDLKAAAEEPARPYTDFATEMGLPLDESESNVRTLA